MVCWYKLIRCFPVGGCEIWVHEISVVVLAMCLYLRRNAELTGQDDRVLTSSAASPSHWFPPASPGLLIGQPGYYLVPHWTDSAIKWSSTERLLLLHRSKNLIEILKIPHKDLLITGQLIAIELKFGTNWSWISMQTLVWYFWARSVCSALTGSGGIMCKTGIDLSEV